MRFPTWAGTSTRTLIAITLLAVTVAAVAAILTDTGGSSTAAQPGAIAGTATTVVRRRDLVEREIQTGTLTYCGDLNVYGRLAGTVTWLPRAGAVIRPDHALYRVEGRGVYLMEGTQPVRRTFKTGMGDGADVAQLNRDLRAMGYDPGHEIELDDHFGAATEAAVKRWQDAHGLEQTGKIELGRIVFQPGPRRIEKLDVSLGGSATPQASASASEPATGLGVACAGRHAASATTAAAAFMGAPRPTTAVLYEREAAAREVTFTPAAPPASSTPPASTPTTTTPATPATTPEGPTGTTGTRPPAKQPSKPTPGSPAPTGKAPASKRGVTPSPTTPSASGNTKSAAPASSGPSGSAKTGGSGESSAQAAPGVVLVTTSLGRVVTVALETSKQSEARTGESVQVTLPSTRVVPGHIASVAGAATPPATGGSGGSTAATVNVEITLDRTLGAAGLDQAPVSVAFAAQRQSHVLSIPVTALVATAGGGYAVEEVRGTTRVLAPVTPGIYAGGYVAITGVPEGTVVTNASQ